MHCLHTYSCWPDCAIDRYWRLVTICSLRSLSPAVTEREIQNGILRARDTSDHTLAYLRNIDGLNVSVLRTAKFFIDIAGRDVDEDAQQLLKNLRDEKIPAAMTEKNIAR